MGSQRSVIAAVGITESSWFVDGVEPEAQEAAKLEAWEPEAQEAELEDQEAAAEVEQAA